MAETIKGINVVIGAETTGLQAALKDVEKQSRGIQSELRQVERLLKFDPKNTELLVQKQKLLGDQVAATKEKLDRLRQVQDQIAQQFKEGKISEEQYRAFRREVIETENKLKHFEKQLKDTQDRSKQFAERMGDLSKKLEQVGKAFMPVSGAAAAASAGLIGLAVNAGRVADDLNTMAKTISLSTETLQKFKYAEDVIDVSTETLAKSLARLTRRMGDAQYGTERTQQAFEKLGVNIYDASGHLRNSEDVFYDVIAALGKIESQADRDVISMELFGRSAQELNPLIMGGAEALKQMGDEAERAGLIMSQETLDAINEFNDEIDILKATASATFLQLGATIGQALLPSLKNLAERFKDVLAWIRGLDERVLKIIIVVSGLVAAIAPAILILAKITTAIKTLVPVFAALNKVMLGNPIGIVITAAAALAAIAITVWKNWDKVSAWLQNAWNNIAYTAQQAFSSVKIYIMQFIENALEVLSKLSRFLPGVADAINNLKEKVRDMITAEEEKRLERYTARMAEAQKATEELVDPTDEAKKKVDELAQAEAALAQAQEEQVNATEDQIKKTKELTKERAKYEEEWTRKRFEQTSTRKEILLAEMREELARAKELGAETTNIVAYYSHEIAKIDAEEKQKIADYEKKWNEQRLQEEERYRLARARSVEEEYAIRLAQLNRQKEAELAIAKEMGAERQAILDYYALKEKELLDWKEEAYRKSAERSAEAFMGFVDTIGSGSKTLKEALKEMVISAISNLQKKILAEALAAQALAWAWSLQTFGASLSHLVTVAGKVLPQIAALEGIKAGVRSLAEGGKATAPALAVIGDNPRYDEAVLPLSPKVFKEIGKGIAAHLPQGDGRKIEFHFHIGNMIGDRRGMKKLAQDVFSYEYEIKSRIGVVPT